MLNPNKKSKLKPASKGAEELQSLPSQKDAQTASPKISAVSGNTTADPLASSNQNKSELTRKSSRSSGKRPISKRYVPSSSEDSENDSENENDGQENDNESVIKSPSTSSAKKKKTSNELMTVNMDDLDNLLSKPNNMYYAKKSAPPASKKSAASSGGDADPITCQICHKTFKKTINLQLHMEKVHEMNSKPELVMEDLETHKCSQCSREFVNEQALSKHLIEHEKEAAEPKPQVSVVSQNVEKKAAVTSKAKGDEVKATCPHCGQTFRRLYNMKTHIDRVHNKVKPFKCNRCDKSFATKSDLKQHLSTHGEGRLFKCEICDRE